jgi:type I restriction enzyme M protein
VPPKSNANYGWILNMVSKLSENGVAGFILANGALSGGGEEYKIRRKLIENNLVEAILVLPRNLFYTTDISVTLWIVNKNKKAQNKKVGDETRNYRDREKEILFLDLRQMGEPFEKKFTQFSDTDIQKVVNTYHQWQTEKIENIPEFCYAASFDEVAKKDFSLVPSKYIEFVNRDEDIDFDEKMQTLRAEFAELLNAEAQSKSDLLTVFKELGYEINL